jgi:hypothetical protein
MTYKKFRFLFALLLTCSASIKSFAAFENKEQDTTIVGNLIKVDSIVESSNTSRGGFRYYYGIFHIRVVMWDVMNNKYGDTLTLAYVYNKITENDLYHKQFNLTLNRKYIFHISPFIPCRSDFPDLEGVCGNDYEFYPIHSEIADKYVVINRIIFFSLYKAK